MKISFLLGLLILLIFYETYAQEKTIWKEMNKEFENCGSSLKLYDDNSFFYEEFCEGIKFKFCIGNWTKQQDNIYLNPRTKESFTLTVVEKNKPENFSGIKVLDIHNKPISKFDFIQFPQDISLQNALTDMDDYISFTGKPNLTKISMPIQSDEAGIAIPYFTNKEGQLLAYDLYQISGTKETFKVKSFANTTYTVKINLPAEIFRYSAIEYYKLPYQYIKLDGVSYEFITKSK